MKNYTRGKWSENPQWKGFIIGEDGKTICQVAAYASGFARRDANTARILACVNACDGIPTEALNGVNLQEKLTAVDGIVKKALLLADDYCSQRDELLAALELAVEQMESDAVGIEYECGCGRGLEELDRLGQLPEAILEARAAIARVKGGAS